MGLSERMQGQEGDLAPLTSLLSSPQGDLWDYKLCVSLLSALAPGIHPEEQAHCLADGNGVGMLEGGFFTAQCSGLVGVLGDMWIALCAYSQRSPLPSLHPANLPTRSAALDAQPGPYPPRISAASGCLLVLSKVPCARRAAETHPHPGVLFLLLPDRLPMLPAPWQRWAPLLAAAGRGNCPFPDTFAGCQPLLRGEGSMNIIGINLQGPLR